MGLPFPFDRPFQNWPNVFKLHDIEYMHMVIHRSIPYYTILVVYKEMMAQPFLYDRPFHNGRVYLNSPISNICPCYYMVSYTEIQNILYKNQWSSFCSKLWKTKAGHNRMGHQCLYERPFRNDRVYLTSRVFIIFQTDRMFLNSLVSNICAW